MATGWHRRHEWTDEMISFMRENYPKYGGNGMVPLMEEKFGIEFNAPTLIQRARVLGIKIEKQSSWFDKGNVPHNYLEDGEERLHDDGRRFMKVNGKWVLKSRIVWEQANSAIPHGYRIIFVDGDQSNCELSNLRCIPLRWTVLLVKKHWYGKGAEIVDCGIAWCALHCAIDELQKSKGQAD